MNGSGFSIKKLWYDTHNEMIVKKAPQISVEIHGGSLK